MRECVSECGNAFAPVFCTLLCLRDSLHFYAKNTLYCIKKVIFYAVCFAEMQECGCYVALQNAGNGAWERWWFDEKNVGKSDDGMLKKKD